MKILNLLLIVCLYAACSQNGDEHKTSMSKETMQLITTTEDSLRMMNELMNKDTGMPMPEKMNMMHQRASMIEKNTGMLMKDSMMWMDAEMNKMNDSMKMLDEEMRNGTMGNAGAMKMMEEKTTLLQKQWQKTKTMKQEMETMKQIATDKMHKKNR